MPTRAKSGISSEQTFRSLRSAARRLPCPVESLSDLRPGRALRTSLLDRGVLHLLQDLLHLCEGVEDDERLVAGAHTEHRPPVATQDFFGNPLDQPRVVEIIRTPRFMT